MSRARLNPILDRDGEPVTQERWNAAQAEIDRLRQGSAHRILRLPEVLRRVGLGKTQVYELIAAERFPVGIKLSERATGWLESDVEKFLEERLALSRGMPVSVGARSGASRRPPTLRSI